MEKNKVLAKKDKGRPRNFDREEALKKALNIFWQKGYEPTSLAELCEVMEIKAPSLYSAFSSKSKLFIEAMDYYEKTYWAEIEDKFLSEPDIFKAVEDFFLDAAVILLSPQTPCGCLVVLSAINISAEEKEVIEKVQKKRLEMKNKFLQRLKKAILDGQIPADSDVPTLAGVFNTILEGMSLQARSGIFLSELKAIASYAVKLLPK